MGESNVPTFLLSDSEKIIDSLSLTKGKYLVIFGTEVIFSGHGEGLISVGLSNQFSNSKGSYLSTGVNSESGMSLIGVKFFKVEENKTLYICCKAVGSNVRFYPYSNVIKLR